MAAPKHRRNGGSSSKKKGKQTKTQPGTQHLPRGSCPIGVWSCEKTKGCTMTFKKYDDYKAHKNLINGCQLPGPKPKENNKTNKKKAERKQKRAEQEGKQKNDGQPNNKMGNTGNKKK
ncbi:hypothetical protein ACH5RR_024650 [Cinchona calisaya]|uniref:Uncharacterized protein n=1 Tax=Cinchona calisaya TaxID=153742 RepID=A0ABD2YXB5_9GENT